MRIIDMCNRFLIFAILINDYACYTLRFFGLIRGITTIENIKQVKRNTLTYEENSDLIIKNKWITKLW